MEDGPQREAEQGPDRGDVYVTKAYNRRRRRSVVPRRRRVTAWYSDEEHGNVLAFAAAARMAPAAYVAQASLRPSAWKVGASLDRIQTHPDPDSDAVDGPDSGASGSDPRVVRAPDSGAVSPDSGAVDGPDPDASGPDPGTVRALDPDASVLPDGVVFADPPEPFEAWQMLLLELMGIHRQLRGAATNLNQAVAKLHSLGVPVDELPAVAAYVRKVAAAAADDAVVSVVRSWRPRRRR